MSHGPNRKIRIDSICPATPSYPREEMEEMVERWLKCCLDSEVAGNWKETMPLFYREDAEYHWNVGPSESFVARGRDEIRDVALGYHMDGFEEWSYPYHDIIIDEKRGTVLGFWKQISPHTREDGSQIVIQGLGGSWFQYGGDFQWSWQHDFFDFGNAKDTFFELAGRGLLEPVVKKKIHMQAKGELMPGHYPISSKKGMGQKIKESLAMVKIAMMGK